jgi:hypothetical protein
MINYWIEPVGALSPQSADGRQKAGLTYDATQQEIPRMNDMCLAWHLTTS